MNTWITKMLLTITAISIAVFLVIKISPPISISSIVSQKDSLFTVSGEGKVTVIPDTGIVNLGMTVNKSTVKAAQTEANTVINNISKNIKDLGIESKDIRTSGYNIYPQYDYQGSVNRITGYQINISLTVTVRDIDKINTVIDSATSLGANSVGGIQLTVDEDRQKELLQEARKKAVDDAKNKAQNLASAAGITLGKIINIQESSGGYPRPMMAYDKVSAAGLGGGGTEIEVGSTDISTSVTLSYETR
jgi:uncharacterized protein YggE